MIGTIIDVIALAWLLVLGGFLGLVLAAGIVASLFVHWSDPAQRREDLWFAGYLGLLALTAAAAVRVAT